MARGSSTPASGVQTLTDATTTGAASTEQPSVAQTEARSALESETRVAHSLRESRARVVSALIAVWAQEVRSHTCLARAVDEWNEVARLVGEYKNTWGGRTTLHVPAGQTNSTQRHLFNICSAIMGRDRDRDDALKRVVEFVHHGEHATSWREIAASVVNTVEGVPYARLPAEEPSPMASALPRSSANEEGVGGDRGGALGRVHGPEKRWRGRLQRKRTVKRPKRAASPVHSG